jgi:hypothetical protein
MLFGMVTLHVGLAPGVDPPGSFASDP